MSRKLAPAEWRNSLPCRPDEQRLYEHFRRQFAMDLLSHVPGAALQQDFAIALLNVAIHGGRDDEASNG